MQIAQPTRQILLRRRRYRAVGYIGEPVAIDIDNPPSGIAQTGVQTDQSHTNS